MEPSIDIPETAVPGPRLPWMKFWVADLLSSSFVLSLSEVDFARYVKLLFRAWESDTPCFLPNDIQILARFAGASSLKSFKQTWEIISSHFTPTRDGKYVFNSKERLTFQKQCNLIDRNVQNGNKNAQRFNNQHKADNLGIPNIPPTTQPRDLPTAPNLLARRSLGLQEVQVVPEVQEQKLSPPTTSTAHPDTPSGERRIIDSIFAFYCATFERDSKRYQLSEERRKKAGLRFRERLKANDGNEAAVENEFGRAIENLAADDFLVNGGWVDWIANLFKSQEEFEKRLNWKPKHGGNRNGNGTGKLDVLADIRRSREQAAANGMGRAPAPIAHGQAREPQNGPAVGPSTPDLPW